MSRWALHCSVVRACLSDYCADGYRQAAWALLATRRPTRTSRPFTRVAEQRRGALSGLSGVWPQANAAPARHLMQPHSRQRDAVAVPSDLHACRHAAVLAVCAAGFTCRDLLALRTHRGAALIALTCDCHELPIDNVRQTELRQPKLCPQSNSLARRDWAPACHSCARSHQDASPSCPVCVCQ